MTIRGLALAAVLLALAPGAAAAAPPALDVLVPRAQSFGVDGTGEVAWNTRAYGPITLLDPATGERRTVDADGCDIEVGEEGPGAFALYCRAEPTRRVLNVKTGAVTPLTAREPQPLVAECAAVRRALARYESGALFGDLDAAAVLRTPTAGRRAFERIDLLRCGRPPLVLERRARGFSSPNVGSGWATWDDGFAADTYLERGHRRTGTLHAVNLRTARRWRWTLPQRPIEACDATTSGPFGWSTHTATHVFWVAALDVVDGSHVCFVGRERIFWAPLPGR